MSIEDSDDEFGLDDATQAAMLDDGTVGYDLVLVKGVLT